MGAYDAAEDVFGGRGGEVGVGAGGAARGQGSGNRGGHFGGSRLSEDAGRVSEGGRVLSGLYLRTVSMQVSDDDRVVCLR